MQVEIKEINATSSEIKLTVEAERTEQAYQKYLNKVARTIEIPGFRKGKAPLSMVERMHGATISDHFQKDLIDEVFGEAVKEHDIHFLLYPEVKDLSWERGSEMKVQLEIEHEPKLELKQLEGLRIPYRPLVLEDEAQRFLEQLASENATIQDVEMAENEDMVEGELTLILEEKQKQFNVYIFAGDTLPQRCAKELLGARTGDTVSLSLSGNSIKLMTRDASLKLDNEISYPCSMLVGSIVRRVVPVLDDEFAKDMEYENYEQLKQKVMEDMRPRLEQQNIHGQNQAVISQLFLDNRFDLPLKTIKHLAEEETQKAGNPRYKDYLAFQYQTQFAQEFIRVYVLKALGRQLPLELTDEMLQEYILHSAIIADKTVEAYKETEREWVDSDQFKENALDFHRLRKIAASSEFRLPEPEPEAGGEDETTDEYEV